MIKILIDKYRRIRYLSTVIHKYQWLKETKMSNLLRISDAASLALHTMSILAESPEQWVSAHSIAERLSVSENHLSKVCQRLSHMGLIETVRGPKGGMKLARPADQVTLLDIYETIDGKLVKASCLFREPKCNRAECILGDLMCEVNRLVAERFSSTTLDKLANWAHSPGS